IGTAGDRKERRGEPGHVPEIPPRPAERHESAETGEGAHASQERPAILRERGGKSEGRQAAYDRSRQTQHALVQRLADSRQGTEGNGKAGPKRIVPIHGKGDAVGEHHRERRLRRCLDAIGKYSPLSHVCSNSLLSRYRRYKTIHRPIVRKTRARLLLES